MIIGAVFLSLSALAGTQTASRDGLCLTIAAAGVLSSGAVVLESADGVSRRRLRRRRHRRDQLGRQPRRLRQPLRRRLAEGLTHSTEAGMFAVSAVLIVGALVTLTMSAKLVNR